MSRYQGLIGETTSHRGFNGDPVEDYFARPLGAGPFPSVIVVHHNPGWDDATKELALRLAFEGYATICPNLFGRVAPDASADDAAAAARAEGGVADEQVVGDLGGAADFLRALPYTNGKVGLIGFCSGGRQAYIAGTKLDVDAVVSAHGGRVVQKDEELTEKQPVAPLSMTKDMRAPLLGLFGEEDQNPSPEHMAIMKAELEKNGKTFEFYSYPGAGHEFMNPRKPSYRIEAAQDAWDRLLSFYDKHLAG